MTCTHHWMVDDNNVGRCKHCGAEHTFPRDPALTVDPKSLVGRAFNKANMDTVVRLHYAEELAREAA